ncbi:MAG: hypothetical protein M3O70_09175 [Actinomycetota bacterium]|nr:hypothetical protein [Actinomycetota bacterium]
MSDERWRDRVLVCAEALGRIALAGVTFLWIRRRRASWRSWRPAGFLATCLIWALALAGCGRTEGPEPRQRQEEEIAVTYANVADLVDALQQAGVPCEAVGPVAPGTGQCQMVGSLLTTHVMRIGEQLPYDAPTDQVTYWATGPNWAAYTTDAEMAQRVREALGSYRRGALPPPGPTCHDEPATIVGTSGDDMLDGTAGDDVILARDGNDRVQSLTGRDRVCAGGGDDSIESADGNDGIDAGPGADRVVAGGLGYFPPCPDHGACADVGDAIEGGPGDDRLEAGDDRDMVRGGDGNDLLLGQGGDDRLAADEGNDVLDGGDGYDAAVFAAAPRAISASLVRGGARGWGEDHLIALEQLWGSRFGDVLEGDDGDNEIRGDPQCDEDFGDDILQGLGGNDWLVGCGGADQLFGGDGDDGLNGDHTNDKPGYEPLDGGNGFDICYYGRPLNCEETRG